MEMRTRSQVRITGESCTRLYPPKKKGGRKPKTVAPTAGGLFSQDCGAPAVVSTGMESHPDHKSKQGNKVVKSTAGGKGMIPV